MGNDIEACHLIEPSAHVRKLPHHSQNGDGGLDGYRNLERVRVKVNSYAKTEAEEEDHVLCHIRTLQPDLDFENLTATLPFSMEKTGVLKLVCNDVLFFESLISPNQLRGFSELYELSIDKCKIKHVPSESFAGLEHLKRLRINTGNSDWAARSLDLSVGAFENVPSLQSLDLGFNHMWSLPDKLLCQLEYLQTLNLTYNLLSDIDDLGFPSILPIGRVAGGLLRNPSSIESREFVSTGISTSRCLSELKSLDLSHNTLRRLGSRRLERMKRLEDLRLQHNWLEELDDEALAGLGGLKSLNISSNRLVALPPPLFQHSKQLRSLDLRNNSLATLSPGLLAGLEWLVVLDLSRNSLTSQWIMADAFRGLVRLVILNLSHNKLTELSPATFSDLYTLQVLDLGNNEISSIPDSTFMPMSNLHSLNLGRNKLLSISPKMLNGLYVLHKLILDYNELSSIQEGSMRNCTSLSDLGLVGNQLETVPEALRGLQYLKTLDLGENRISTLSNDSFQGMSQLYGLRLVDNKLEEIPKGVCDPITDLRVFNAAQNKINKVSSSAFVSCPELRVLRLDSNSLEDFPSSLAPQLPKLLWLNVSQNRIGRADYSLLPSSLEWFDVSHNQLESLGGAWTSSGSTLGKGGQPTASAFLNPHSNHHSVHHNARLRVVDASHNKLTQLDVSGIPPGLDRLTLSYNRLVKIWPDTFSRSNHLRRVDLIGNQLENIPLAALRFQRVPHSKALPEIFIGGNPFLCDCDMEWLLRITQLSSTRQYPVVLDLDAVVCRLTYSRSVTHIPLPEIKPRDFLCPYTFHCFQTCQCCEFDACDCSMTCPSNCTCYHGDSWTANVVDCADSNLTRVPSRIPMDSTNVALDGNFIPVLKSHSFIGRKTLRILFLNSSRIETISNKSFNGLQSLELLHLEQNRISRLHGYEFDHLNKLRELYLQDNLIESISNSTFLSLKELEILRLDGNRISAFTVWQLSLNPYLVEIGLGRNYWNCDCSFLHQLYGWVTDNSKKIIDLGDMRCVWNTTQEPGPHLIDYNSTCGTSWALIQGHFDYFDFNSLLPLIIGISSALLLIFIIITLIFLCRENVRVWLHNQFGLRLCNVDGNFVDSEKSYDAYLLYSQKDEEFVSTRVADELETSENYRLCLHYRDLISESGDLKEMMSNALDNSKSLVIFLSRNFFQGEWTSGEYRAGFHSLLKSSAKRSGSVRSIIVLFVEDIPEEELSPDIRSWLRNSSHHVTLKWSDKKFWSKFKYSLPDPSCHYHSNITSHTTTSSAASSERTSSAMKYYPGELQSAPCESDSTPNGACASAINGQPKYWPYVPTGNNFVALPPKYASHGYQFGVGTPGVLTTVSRNQVPPCPQVTTGEQDEDGHDIPSFLFQPNAKSPVPLGNFGKSLQKSSSSGTTGGESYLSLEGEHVYSTLDPPSPLSKIQLPNGYTYSPGPHSQQPWHAHPPPPKAPLPNFSSPKNKARRKSSKDGPLPPNGTVQTYLV